MGGAAAPSAPPQSLDTPLTPPPPPRTLTPSPSDTTAPCSFSHTANKDCAYSQSFSVAYSLSSSPNFSPSPTPHFFSSVQSTLFSFFYCRRPELLRHYITYQSYPYHSLLTRCSALPADTSRTSCHPVFSVACRQWFVVPQSHCRSSYHNYLRITGMCS